MGGKGGDKSRQRTIEGFFHQMLATDGIEFLAADAGRYDAVIVLKNAFFTELAQHIVGRRALPV